MQLFEQVHPPPIVLIHRDLLRPGNEAAYSEIEADSARILRDALPLQSEHQVVFPKPYLAAEALTGPKEVWFFTGWNSLVEYSQVSEEYSKNTALAAALERNSKHKAALTFDPVSAFAHYRQELSRGAPWSVGRGRFLVILVTNRDVGFEGTVFETVDGTRFVVTAAQARDDADASAAAAGSDARVFRVHPDWSRPAREWVAADPAFWQPRAPAHDDAVGDLKIRP